MTEQKTVVEIVAESPYVTSFTFKQPEKEKKEHELRLEKLKTLFESKNPLKYICIGKTVEYREFATTTMQPFRTVSDAVHYGKSLLLKESFPGQKYHGSFIIQPLLEGEQSFVLTTDEINKILELESVYTVELFN